MQSLSAGQVLPWSSCPHPSQTTQTDILSCNCPNWLTQPISSLCARLNSTTYNYRQSTLPSQTHPKASFLSKYVLQPFPIIFISHPGVASVIQESAWKVSLHSIKVCGLPCCPLWNIWLGHQKNKPLSCLEGWKPAPKGWESPVGVGRQKNTWANTLSGATSDSESHINIAQV